MTANANGYPSAQPLAYSSMAGPYVPLTLRSPAPLRAGPDIHVRAFAGMRLTLHSPGTATQRRDSGSPHGLRPLPLPAANASRVPSITPLTTAIANPYPSGHPLARGPATLSVRI